MGLTSPADDFEAEREARERATLLMMLSFIEAECRRLGATEAAKHAALAATLMPGSREATDSPPLAARLH